MPNLTVVGQKVWARVEICQKLGLLRPIFQGYSRSSQVRRYDRVPAISVSDPQ